MCGILFSKNLETTQQEFETALSLQNWRGPDASIAVFHNGAWLGHVRLSIVDPRPQANQPFLSKNGRFQIIFNGEIYNHIDLRARFNLECKTMSDTETLIEGFSTFGIDFLNELEGMFALVILDRHSGDWWAARDPFGIKPLFQWQYGNKCILSSECRSIRSLKPELGVDELSLNEWRFIRRPCRGFTFFEGIKEVEPGCVLKNGIKVSALSRELCQNSSANTLSDISATIGEVLQKSISAHEMSDVTNVCLLSGGIDSTLIAHYSDVFAAYTVGLEENNEFAVAQESAELMQLQCNEVVETDETLMGAWEHLIRLRGEPISVPNEGLIFRVCAAMAPDEKVVLTGEGADELFFGYDRVFRWASNTKNMDLREFWKMYAYGDDTLCTERLLQDVMEISEGKAPIEFTEDFFLTYHLTALLRRMDSASMAASKEARVPFVSRSLFSLLYRVPTEIKLNKLHAKLPLRKLISETGYQHVLGHKKIGFSATMKNSQNRYDEYERFQNFNLEVLKW